MRTSARPQVSRTCNKTEKQNKRHKTQKRDWGPDRRDCIKQLKSSNQHKNVDKLGVSNLPASHFRRETDLA